MTLPDWMIRDPFAKPQDVREVFTAPSAAAMHAALVKLVGEPTRTVLVCTPADDVCRIIGAKVGGTCAACAQHVWLSPSSRDVDALLVCMRCLVGAMDAQA